MPAHKPFNGSLQTRAIGGERRGGCAGTDANDRGTIGRPQMIDERIHGTANGERPSQADVRLVHHEHDEAPASRILVSRVADRSSRQRRLFLRLESDPLGTDHTAVGPVHAHRELTRLQISNGHAATVDYREIDRGQLDRGTENRLSWLLRTRRRERCQRQRQRAGEVRKGSAHLNGAAR